MPRLTRFKRHMTYANVASSLALLIAISGGTAIASGLAHNVVKSKNIKNGQVKSADLANSAVTGSKLRNSAVTGSKIAPGAVSDDKLGSLYQFGNGQSSSTSGTLGSGDDTSNFPIPLFNGDIVLACGVGNPTVVFNDGQNTFPTEVWDNGAHTSVADGGMKIISLTSPSTHTVQIVGADDVTDTLVISLFVDGSGSCHFGVSQQSNF